MSGPGLPAVLGGESYSCHFEDSQGRFNITVASMEVTPGTQYTCNITNIAQQFGGVQAGKFPTNGDTYMVMIVHPFAFFLFPCSDAFQFCKFSGWNTI